MLKAELKNESVDQLMCAHGMCAPPARLTWKEIYATISQKHLVIIGEYRNKRGRVYEWKFRYRWVELLLSNPLKWKSFIQDWVIEDQLAKTLSSEIQKELDAEIVQLLVNLGGVEMAKDPESIRQLKALAGHE